MSGLEWEGYTTSEEQQMARELMEVEEGDKVQMVANSVEESLTVFYVDDRPGVRELRARPDPTDSSIPDVKLYVVRGRYVFIIADYPSGQRGIIMDWPNDEPLGEHFQILREDDGG